MIASLVFEDGVWEPVLAEILPSFLHRVELRGTRRQQDRSDCFSARRACPRCAIRPCRTATRRGHPGRSQRPSHPLERATGLTSVIRCDLWYKLRCGGRFRRAELHHVGVGIGQRREPLRRRGLGRSRRTDRRCHSAGRPVGEAAFRAVLLADAGLILEADFDRRRLRQSSEMSLQRARESPKLFGRIVFSQSHR